MDRSKFRRGWSGMFAVSDVVVLLFLYFLVFFIVGVTSWIFASSAWRARTPASWGWCCVSDGVASGVWSSWICGGVGSESGVVLV